ATGCAVKRPEGFDKRQQPAEPAGRAARPRKHTRQARTTPPRTQATTRTRTPAVPSPMAQKELRLASRARRRYEKSEIRRFTRRTRHRRVGWAVVVGIVGVLAGLLAVAIYSPLLALRTIRVEGTVAVSASEVADAIDGQLGTPLALLDYDRIR